MGDWRSALVWACLVAVAAVMIAGGVELLDRLGALLERRRRRRFALELLRALIDPVSVPGGPRESFPSDELAARREARERRTGGV